jgi:6-phosphogluconolactonase
VSSPVRRFEDVGHLHQAVVEAFCAAVEETLTQQPVFRLSLSGGSTPKRLYELLAGCDLPWDRIHWFWGDERNVADDHPDSNARMVRRAWLDPIAAPESNIHPVEVDAQDPSRAAKKYRETLRSFFPDQPFPEWDLVLLGMGDDGHTASLFPHTAALDERQLWFVENWVESLNTYRYTLTSPAINSGRRIWFLVAGETKRPALEAVFSASGDAHQYPSRLIHPTQWWIA